jgi:hypothetical protein
MQLTDIICLICLLAAGYLLNLFHSFQSAAMFFHWTNFFLVNNYYSLQAGKVFVQQWKEYDDDESRLLPLIQYSTFV